MADRVCGGNSPEPGKCGAKLRGSNPPRYCRKPPVKGKTRCRLHGGAAGAGRPITHGRYAKTAPNRLAVLFREFLDQPDLVTLSSEIAFLDALIADALRSLNPDATAWESAFARVVGIRDAITSGKAQDLLRALEALEEVVSRGKAEALALDNVLELIERRRRLVRDEAQRVKGEADTITARDVALVVAKLADIVSRYVTGRAARAKISAELVEALGVSKN